MDLFWVQKFLRVGGDPFRAQLRVKTKQQQNHDGFVVAGVLFSFVLCGCCVVVGCRHFVVDCCVVLLLFCCCWVVGFVVMLLWCVCCVVL